MTNLINSIPKEAIALLIPVFACLWLAWVIIYSTSKRNNPT